MNKKISIALICLIALVFSFACVIPLPPPEPAQLTFSKTVVDSKVTVDFANPADANDLTRTIHYTIDGSTPTKVSPSFTELITIEANKSLVVRAFILKTVKVSLGGENFYKKTIETPVEYQNYILTVPSPTFRSGTAEVTNPYDFTTTLSTLTIASDISANSYFIFGDEIEKIKLTSPTLTIIYDESKNKAFVTYNETFIKEFQGKENTLPATGYFCKFKIRIFSEREGWTTSTATTLDCQYNINPL